MAGPLQRQLAQPWRIRQGARPRHRQGFAAQVMLGRRVQRLRRAQRPQGARRLRGTQGVRVIQQPGQARHGAGRLGGHRRAQCRQGLGSGTPAFRLGVLQATSDLFGHHGRHAGAQVTSKPSPD